MWYEIIIYKSEKTETGSHLIRHEKYITNSIYELSQKIRRQISKGRFIEIVQFTGMIDKINQNYKTL